MALGDLPRVPRRARLAAQGHQLLGLHRPLRAAHLRDGRARLRRTRRPRTTSRRWSSELRERARGRRHRLHHLAHRPTTRRPTTSRWRAGWPTWERGATAGRGDGRAERRHVRGRGRGAWTARRRPGLRDYYERLRDLAVETGRPITFGLFSRARTRPASGALRSTCIERDRRGGRAHVRPGAQPGAQRAALVQDPAAVRPAAGVAGDARAAARRAEDARCAIPSCAAAGRGRRASATRPARRSAPRRGRRTTTGSS